MIERYVNTIQNMDCLKMMKQLPDNCIDCIVTDPPYGINFCSSRTNRKAFIKNDSLEDWKMLIDKMLPEFKRILTDAGCCCCCGGGGGTPVTAILTMEVIKHFNLIQTLVWEKFIGLGWKYRPAYENILIFSKNKTDYNFFDTTKKCSNVIRGINQDIPNSEEHPTQKPIPLMAKLIKIHTLENNIVLDPFMGTGATVMASMELKRRYIGCELDKGYFDIAQKRIDDYNKQLKLF